MLQILKRVSKCLVYIVLSNTHAKLAMLLRQIQSKEYLEDIRLIRKK